MPWFPRNISELDRNANKIQEAGAELKSDHPVRAFYKYEFVNDLMWYFGRYIASIRAMVYIIKS